MTPANNSSALLIELTKFINYGYRFAYGYREDSTFEDAITFKMITTSRQSAIDLANNTHIAVGADVKRVCAIWDLKEELEKIKL